MRIAVHATGEVGKRAILILLNETGLTELGMVHGAGPADPRVRPVESAEGFDVVVTDDRDPAVAADLALRAETSLVTWGDDVTVMTPAAHASVLTGASLAGGIAPALAIHEVARAREPLEQLLAWTEPGRPLRRGEAIPFPDPVGSRWGVEVEGGDRWSVPTRLLVAPVDGEWAAASARVTGILSDGVVQRIVGVADLASHLEAIALAAGAATVALGHAHSGHQRVLAVAEPFLSKCLEMGLAVATYSLAEEPQHHR